MIPVQHFSTAVLADILRRQPSSPARTALAWQLAVGPTLAKATRVTLERGVLRVSASDARWLKEVSRAGDVVLGRLQQLLGADVTRVAVESSDPRRP